MRALKYKNRKRILAAILASGCFILPRIAFCHEPVAPGLRTESVPVSNVPLPNIEALPHQKPTSAFYAPQEIVAINWDIAANILDASDQKTEQSKCVSADCISAPLGVELPPCDEPLVPVRIRTAELLPAKVKTREVCTPPTQIASTLKGSAEAAPVASSVVLSTFEGVQKPALKALPVPQEIVQVNWSIRPQSTDARAEYRTSAAFQASHCPLVLWNDDSFEEVRKNAVHPISTPAVSHEMENGTGQAHVASIERHDALTVDPQTLNELQKLAAIPGADSSGVTYLSELTQLLDGQSSWLFVNEDLLDLAPEEGSVAAVSYLDDLNGLVKKRERRHSDSDYRRTVAPQQTPAGSVPSTPKKPSKPYTSIAPDPVCPPGSGVGVSSIFQSVSSIRLNGLSTDPPSRPREDAASTAELPRPENQACQYLDSYSPAYYATPVRYGSHRPSRDTHVFCHRPLYFEDANLERCGQSNGCLTTATSVVHFATLIAFSPYSMLAEHPADCVRSLPDCPTCHSFE